MMQFNSQSFCLLVKGNLKTLELNMRIGVLLGRSSELRLQKAHFQQSAFDHIDTDQHTAFGPVVHRKPFPSHAQSSAKCMHFAIFVHDGLQPDGIDRRGTQGGHFRVLRDSLLNQVIG